MNIRERRRIGLTVASVVATARVCVAAGTLSKNMTPEEMSLVVASAWAIDAVRGGQDAAKLDLDAILEFIERILPLILTIIDLFS